MKFSCVGRARAGRSHGTNPDDCPVAANETADPKAPVATDLNTVTSRGRKSSGNRRRKRA